MLGALMFTPDAHAQLVIGGDTAAEAEADADAAADSESGAFAATGDVITTFEAPESPDTLTIHSAPMVSGEVPQPTAQCVVTRGGGFSMIYVGASYGGGRIDKLCQDLEIIRVIAGAFQNDPIMRQTAVEYARMNIPGIEEAYMRAQAMARVGNATFVQPPQPAQSPEQVATAPTVQVASLQTGEVEGPQQ